MLFKLIEVVYVNIDLVILAFVILKQDMYVLLLLEWIEKK
ncbi:hypothetical protein MHY_05690 [Megamonas hypermegale ART12/1]|nr:hypothetical protein MHY_05690 [Megamonas hypermegale ART12/1]